jgi:flagellar P-ring protein precursor FlgI
MVLLYMLLLATSAAAVRLKDVAAIQGVRNNQLVGYGLVAGLDGTGDDTKKGRFTSEALANFLDRLGLPVEASTVDLDNVAAVMVTAELPPFARSGTRLDVVVSSIGDADSLQGGTLIMTPLRGADGRVYAMAQGGVSIGGFSLGRGGTSQAQNHPTVGRIANGALVEREPPSEILTDNHIVVNLHRPDFMTVSRISKTINDAFGGALAMPVDASTIEVMPPALDQRTLVPFLATLENLPVVPDTRAKVVFDERTGTVVMGRNVMIDTIAVAHGDLAIQITHKPQVSQPQPFGGGATVVTGETTVKVTEEEARLAVLPHNVEIDDLVQALNSVGVTPRDLMAILQAIKAAGALHADLEIM